MNELNLKEQLELKILKLSEAIWENKVKSPEITKWLSNFETNTDITHCEQIHALYLLSNFMYFGNKEIRELLKSIYRDKIKNPLMQQIRKENGDTKNFALIEEKYDKALKETRFLGLGNPSESGTHLLYFFRQENELTKKLFINTHDILNIKKRVSGNLLDREISLKDPNIKRYIFLDDICGSGSQAISYSENLLKEIHNIDPTIEVSYFSIISTSHGLRNIKSRTAFKHVDCIFELDESYKCFSDNSRYYEGVEKKGISKQFTHEFCLKYGLQFFNGYDPLGFNDGQLLIGFSHNIPDNTLPIFWHEKSWAPILKRYSKVY
ncbi:hypothetical protein ABEH94_05995 [Pantoea agglomerans]|uniref:phosphoribosyltransferase-like protein n=1 Tax=Enterobacter agglomerans TaxID=549 RepID=UPI003208657B